MPAKITFSIAKYFFSFRTLALIGISFCLASCAYQKIVKSRDFKLKLTKANEYYDKGKYEKAQLLYYEIAPYFKSSDQYEFIVYRYAYCSFLMKDYVTSQMMFKDYLSNFPTSERNEEVEYMQAKSFFLDATLGSYFLDPTNTIKALNFFQIFLQNHPGTPRYQDIMDMIIQCKTRLELKDLRAAEQYYSMERYRAAAIYFSNLSNQYSESLRADEYKFKSIEAWFKYASLSWIQQKKERFETVLKEYKDFLNRFPESKYLVRANNLYSQSITIINKLKTYESATSKY